MSTRIDGQCVLHKTISDQCRFNKPDSSCQSEVVFATRAAIEDLLMRTPKDKGFKIHVAVTCERPQKPEPQGETIRSANGNQCCPSCGATGPCECPELT